MAQTKPQIKSDSERASKKPVDQVEGYFQSGFDLIFICDFLCVICGLHGDRCFFYSAV